MTTDYVLVFHASSDQVHWEPLKRDDIPMWLRDEAIIDRLIVGEAVRNIQRENCQGMRWYAVTAVRPMALPKSPILRPEWR
mgnify:CR=1 FL=1